MTYDKTSLAQPRFIYVDTEVFGAFVKPKKNIVHVLFHGLFVTIEANERTECPVRIENESMLF